MISKNLAILLLLPIVIQAKIKVTIVASDKDGERQVHVSGTDVDVISDMERATFHLTDENLKSSIHSYFGALPDDAYLKSPTPWGDLYKTFDWPEVTRVLAPLKAQILSVTSHPVVVSTHVYNNTSPKISKFTAKVQEPIMNTIASIWETTGDLSVHDIDYEFDVIATSVGSDWFSFTAQWGQALVKTGTVTAGSEAGPEITLEPHQSAVAELHAMKGTMRIQVDYEASLIGSTAVNYSKAHQGRHFWSLGIESVMMAGGLVKPVKSSEVIEVSYYTEPKLIVTNMQTNEMLYSIPMKIY